MTNNNAKYFPLKIELPNLVTPTGNQILRWQRSGYYSNIQRLKKTCWNMLLLCGAHEEQYKTIPGERRRVEFHSYRPRKIDDDNLVSGAKYMRDTLEDMGLIWRDSPKFLEASYHQYTDRKNPRTEIIIYLLPDVTPL